MTAFSFSPVDVRRIHLSGTASLSSSKPSSHFHVAACSAPGSHSSLIFMQRLHDRTRISPEKRFPRSFFSGKNARRHPRFKGGFRVYAFGLSLKFRREKEKKKGLKDHSSFCYHSVSPSSAFHLSFFFVFYLPSSTVL